MAEQLKQKKNECRFKSSSVEKLVQERGLDKVQHGRPKCLNQFLQLVVDLKEKDNGQSKKAAETLMERLKSLDGPQQTDKKRKLRKLDWEEEEEEDDDTLLAEIEDKIRRLKRRKLALESRKVARTLQQNVDGYVSC